MFVILSKVVHRQLLDIKGKKKTSGTTTDSG
jgi:hypothetical protein